MHPILLRWRKRTDIAITAILAVTMLLGISLGILGPDSTTQNVGFLLIGASLAALVIPLAEYIKRPQQRHLLAHGLYVELADRVARCCHDYEAPWSDVRAAPANFAYTLQKLQKFAPHPPIIFPATAHQIAILENDALQKLIQFYCQLAAFERDVNAAAHPNNPGQQHATGLDTVALRLHQTLLPGLNALIAFDAMLNNTAALDDAAIAHYNRDRPRHKTGSLRARLKASAAD